MSFIDPEKSSRYVTIPPYTLDVRKKYNLTLTAWNVLKPLETFGDWIVIEIEPSPIIASIKGSRRLTLFNGNEFFIDAEESRDPDTKLNDDIGHAWTCVEEPHLSPCVDINNSPLIMIEMPKYKIEPLTLPPNVTYTF